MPEQIELISLFTAAASVVLGALAWRRRDRSAIAGSLVVVMTGSTWWALSGYVLATTGSTATAAAAIGSLLLASAWLSVGALWHAMVHSGHGARMGRRLGLALAVEPVLLLVAVLVDARTGLLVREVTLGTDLGIQADLGVGLWIHAGYAYLLVTIGVGLQVAAWRRAVTGQRWQFAVVLVATALPVAGTVIALIRVRHSGFIDVTSALLLVTVGIWLWVERYSASMHQVPVTMRHVLEALGDAVLVIDDSGRVVQANPAAREMLGRRAGGLEQVEGAHWSSLVDDEQLDTIRAGQPVIAPDGRVFDVRIAPLTAAEHDVASVVTVRDVTETERLRHGLAELAVRDGLTGLHNRRHLEASIGCAVAQARAAEQPLAAVMVDIDHFKAVNDSLGHVLGDRVLVAVAGVLAAHVRPGDVLVRFGGEEFVALIPGADAPELARRMEQVRAACASVRVDGHDAPLGVTVSVGVATLTGQMSPDALLRAADDALYAAKAAGRDRVVLV